MDPVIGLDIAKEEKPEEWWNSDKIARIILKKTKQQGNINFD